MVSLVAHNKLFYCFTHFSNCHLKIYAIKLKLVSCPVTGTKKYMLIWSGQGFWVFRNLFVFF